MLAILVRKNIERERLREEKKEKEGESLEKRERERLVKERWCLEEEMEF